MKIIFLLLSFIVISFANVGVVVDVVGDSQLLRAGTKIKVAPKLALEEHDLIKTGKNAKVKLFFQDNTAVSLGQNTSFEIDSYLFTGKKDSKIKFKVLKGFFKAVTGSISKVAPEKFELQTKNATIGIRGTVFASEVSDEADVVICTDGTVVLFTSKGFIEINKGEQSYAKSAQAPRVKTYTQKEKEALIESAGWHGSMSLEELIKFIKDNFKEPLRSQLLATVQNILEKDSDSRRELKTNPQVQVANDLGFVDDITINGREFDTLQQREIQFYTEDLQDGKVIVKGLLESLDKKVPVNFLHVEITTDGGDSWSRANGNEDWEWSFEPKVEKSYEFSLRVVKDNQEERNFSFAGSENIRANDNNPEEETALLPEFLYIAGFKLNFAQTTKIIEGKLQGSGSLVVPILQNFGLPSSLDVSFENLSYYNGRVTVGQITYNEPLELKNSLVDISLSSLSFNPQEAGVVGSVKFKGALDFLPSLSLSETSKILPTSFDFDIPVTAQSIDIWSEKNVALSLNAGVIKLSYAQGDSSPSIDASSLSAKLNFGDLLKMTQAGSSVIADVALDLSGFANSTLSFPELSKAYFLDTPFAIEGIDARLDLAQKSLHVSTSVNLDAYTDPMLQALSGSLLEATISSTGFEGAISADGGLEPITLLDRGGVGRDVRVDIQGTPSINLSINGDEFDFGFGELNAEVDFGDILQATRDGGRVQSIKASLKNAANTANEYELNFSNSGLSYVLGSKLGISSLLARLNLSTKSIAFGGSADLSLYDDNPMLKALSGATLSAQIAPSGFSASLTPNENIEPIVILDRGGKGKDISLAFTSSPTIQVSLVGQELYFGLSGGGAKLDFGDLLEGAKVDLNSLKESAYSWSINGRKKLTSNAKLFLSNLAGELDFSNLSSPNITFNATVDLSEYGGILSSISSASLQGAKISKEGLSGAFSVALTQVPIWEEKGVAIHFLQAPSVSFALSRTGVDIGLSNLHADLYFGSLLENSIAHIGDISPDIGGAKKQVSNLLTQTSQNFNWYIEGTKRLMGSDIRLQNLSGAIDISNLSDPAITLFAMADLSEYAQIFQYVKSAGIENAKISKSGFSGTLSANVKDIDIWKEKNVKVAFGKNRAIDFNLDINSNGLKVGLGNVNASLELGSLLDNAKASLSGVGSGLFDWSISGKHAIAGTSLMLEDLVGKVNLSDLKSPVINLNGMADLSGYTTWLSQLQSVALTNAEISKDGFKGSLSATLGNLDIWQAKGVNVSFASPPTLNLKVSRDDFSIGLSNIDASINFGDLLDGEIVKLSQLRSQARGAARGGLEKIGQVQASVSNLRENLEAVKLPTPSCTYAWSLQKPHKLIQDDNGRVDVTSISGNLNLCSLSDPSLLFNAEADFSAYHFDLGNLGQVSVTGATISKNGIDWNNLAFSGASTSFTILDLGEQDDDVRAELYNISGSASSSGSAGVDTVDGMLYFGALFENAEPINLSYNGATRTYSFSTTQELTYTKGDNSIVLTHLSGTVQKVGEDYTVTLHGQSQVHATLLSQVGVETLSINSLGISSSGLQGELQASWENSEVFGILGDKAILNLNRVGVRIDTSLDIPIRLSVFDGYLDLSPVFDEASNSAKALLSLVDSNVAWSFAQPLHVNEKFIFKNLSGTLNLGHLNAPSLGISGNFGYEGIESLNLELSNFKIDSSGISGSVGLGAGTHVAIPGIAGLNISELSVSFGQNISGRIGLVYDKEAFLGSSESLHIALSSLINRNGIESFSITSSPLPSLTIPSFATMAFSDVSVSPSFDNFYINLNGTILPDNPILSADNAVEFENLKISRSGITVDGAGIERDVSGASAELGGLGLSIEKVGIGFSNSKFYVSLKGGLSLVVTQAGAGVKLYSDGSTEVDNIHVLVNNPTLTFGGDISWYKGDGVYGNGFGADGLQLKLVNMFSVSGRFKIGNKQTKGFYWLAQAQGGLGSGIPLGPINIYELGGGAAFNMYHNGHDFVPSGDGNLIIILSSLLGTPDLGFTWHGNINLNIDTAGQIIMEGDTYILSAKESSPENRKVSGTMILGMSPSSLQISGSANLNYMSIGVRGRTDVMFTGREKHVYIGSDAKAEGFNITQNIGHVNVDIFGLHPWGYFMVDTRRLAFGAGYDFDKTLSLDVWGPNPYIRLVLGARADALMQYNPFFMDMSGDAHANLHVGYGDIFDGSLGAGVAMRMRAPNPTYMKVKAYVDIPVYGNASFTTYFPSRPSGGGNSDNLPTLINHVEPYDRGAVSLMPRIKVVSTFNSDGSQFNVGNMEPNSDYHSGEFEVTQTLYYTSKIENVVLRDTATNQSIPLDKNVLSSNEIEFIPRSVLVPNHTYRLSGTAKLNKYTQTTSTSVKGTNELMTLAADPETYLSEHGTVEAVVGAVVKTEQMSEEFQVQAENKLEFSEIVDYVFPENLQEDVLENEQVVIYYNEIVKNLGANNALIRNYRVEVVGADNKPISGSFYYENSDQPKSIFRPTKPMRIYHYCVNDATGEIRETFLNANGEYLNPFKGYKLDGAEEVETQEGGAVTGVNIPAYIPLHAVNNVNIGKFVKNFEDSYSYYTNANYGVVVTDTTNNKVVYFSTFTIKYNLASEESMRHFSAMSDQLHPSLIYHRNLGREYEMRFDLDDDLRNIGAHGGDIGCRVRANWSVQNENEEPQETTTTTSCRDNIIAFHNFDQIVDLLSADMIYYNVETQVELLEKRLDITEGGVYDTTGADRAKEEAMQNTGHVFDNGPMPSDIGNMGGAVGPIGVNVNPGAQVGAGIGQQFNLGAQF